VSPMKIAIAALAAVLIAALLLHQSRPASPPLPRGIPMAMIVNGKPQQRIGLLVSLPGWIPLPEKGYVTGAELFPPQPPFGLAAGVMPGCDEPSDEFIVNYRGRLERAGFAWRRNPILFHLIVDKPDAQYEAD